ncbi:MAG: hypothetical protein ACM3OB_08405 [Acidobacteriota bacterium]
MAEITRRVRPRTGGLGRVDDQGLLPVEGRRKSLIVLSTGKKLSPEPVELAISATAPFHGAPRDYPAFITPTLKIKRDALLAWLGPAVGEVFGAA